MNGLRLTRSCVNHALPLLWSLAVLLGALSQLLAQTLSSQPLNDDFANAIQLESSVETATITGTTLGATREPDEPYNPDGVASVWYKWNPAHGHLRFTPQLGSPSIWIFRGSLDQPVFRSSENKEEGPYLFGTYYIGVFADPANAGDFRFVLESVPFTPPNDLFANAIEVTENDGSLLLTGTTVGASYEPDDPELPSILTVWYQWTPATSQGLRYTILSGNVGVAFFFGSSLTDLKPIPENFLLEGRTHYIVVYSRGSLGPFEIQIGTRPPPPPLNDSFSAAISLPFGSNYIHAVSASASMEQDEPDPGSCFTSQRTVWWKYAPEKTGFLSCYSPGYSHKFAIYRGTTLDSLEHLVTHCGVPVFLDVSAGETYYFQVEPPEPVGESTTAEIVVKFDDVSLNDDFEYAFPLEVYDSYATSGATNVGHNFAATLQPGEPLPAPDASGMTVWYSWVAPHKGEALFDVYGFDETRFAVYRGSSLETLQNVPNPAPVEPGEKYFIQVDSLDGQTSGFKIEVTTRRALPPPNDDFVHAGRLDVHTLHADSATLEPGEPPHRSDPHKSLWRLWNADETGTLTIQASATIAVYSGNHLPKLALRAKGEETVSLRVHASQSYKIALAVPIESTGVINYSTQFIPDNPAFVPLDDNDDFAAAFVISGPTNQLFSRHWRGTVELREPNVGPEGCMMAGQTLWWKYVPEGSGVLHFFPVPGISCALYRGDSLENLQLLAEDCGFGIVYPLEAGEAVYLQAQRSMTVHAPGLILFFEPSLTNDAFANPISITSNPFSTFIYNVGATSEPGEPLAREDANGHSIWYTWTAPYSGRARVTASGTEVRFAVYPAANLQELQPIPIDTMRSSVNFEIAPGEQYFIQVDSAGPFTPGHFRLSLSAEPYRPPNDDFENATWLTTAAWATLNFMNDATIELGEPNHLNQSHKSCWYKFQPGMGGEIQFDAMSIPAVSPTWISVYQGTSLENLQLLAEGERPVFQATSPGEIYHIAVSVPSDAMGDLHASIRFTPNDTYPPLPEDAAFYSRMDSFNNWELEGAGNFQVSDLPRPEAEGSILMPQGPSSLASVFSTVPGKQYQLTFFLSPHPDTHQGNVSRVRVKWDDLVLGIAEAPKIGNWNWAEAAFAVQAQDSLTRLTFENFEGQTLIDAVKVVLNGEDPPWITSHPEDRVTSGGQLTLFVAADGPPPLAYQWYRNSEPLPDQTAASLSLTFLRDTADYSVVVSNDFGSITSRVATVTVLARQTLDFPPIPDAEFGTGSIELQATASSGLPVEFSLASGLATLEGNLVTPAAPGVIWIYARQDGNEDFAGVTPILRSLLVRKGSQSIQFEPIQPTSPAIELQASASSGLPITFEILAGSASLIGNTLSDIAPGPVTIAAVQPGNYFYEPARVLQTFVLERIPQVVVFSADQLEPVAQAALRKSALSDPPPAYQLYATASSGLPVQFQILSGPAILNDATLTFTSPGEVIVQALQPGDIVFAPASAERTFAFYSSASPSLSFSVSGSSLLLTWPGDFNEFSLEGAISLQGPWEVIPFSFEALAEIYSAQIELSGPSKFFRLRSSVAE